MKKSRWLGKIELLQSTTSHNQRGEDIMIRQTVLPFKPENTKDTITPHSGLALLGEFAVGLGLLKSVDKYLPKPGSGAGYSTSEYIFPLLLMLNGGDRNFEDLRQIRKDVGLREILPLERMPCGQYEANAVFFGIWVVAYNTWRLFVLKSLDKTWHRHQVQTIRWRLYQVAGRIVFHVGQVFLKVRIGFDRLFAGIRLRVWEFAND